MTEGWLDATELAGRVRSGNVSPREAVEAAIRRIEAHDGALNSVVFRDFEGALLAADRVDRSAPLAGVPFLVKDLHTEVAGWPLTNGSKLFRDKIDRHDSELVRRLRRAGMVPIGRSAAPELGLLLATRSARYGQTRNPWNLDYSPGGSTGGGAAAVAAGFVPIAHAGDGGGSIRIPACFTGLVGLKPTRLRSPHGPYFGTFWGGLSVEHGLTRSVRDSAALLDAVAGPDPGGFFFPPPPPAGGSFLATVSTPARRLKIALSTESMLGIPPSAPAKQALDAVAAALAALGHELVPAYPDVDPELRLAVARGFFVFVTAHNAWYVRTEERRRGATAAAGDLQETVRAFVELGHQVSAVDFIETEHAFHRISRAFDAFFVEGGYDALLTPTVAGAPPKLNDMDPEVPDFDAFRAQVAPYIAYTNIFNATGQPAISVPAMRTAEGVPMGAMLAARAGEDALLLQVAQQLEGAIGWRSWPYPCGPFASRSTPVS